MNVHRMLQIVLSLILKRRSVAAIAVYPPGIVEQVDVFEYETMSVIDVQYVESVEPLSLDERMKRLNTGVVPWIRLR